MNAPRQVLTGEDGDNPPHSAVSQITAGLGHSHVGRKINIHTRKIRIKSTFLLSGLDASGLSAAGVRSAHGF